MRRIALSTLAVFSFAASLLAFAAPLPYDETADAKAAVQRALSGAMAKHVPVLIVFGANWCEDCRVLDLAMHTGVTAALVEHSFKVVKVDVGEFDRNLELAARYGNPIARGIPAVVVVSADNRVLYTTKAGELANARRMSEDGIYRFLQQISRGGTPR